MITYASWLLLTIVATDTQFNGYEFQLTTHPRLPLAFMQIFGGPGDRHHQRDRHRDRRQPAADARTAHPEQRQLRHGRSQGPRTLTDPRRHVYERHRMHRREPARGRQLLRRRRLQLQRRPPTTATTRRPASSPIRRRATQATHRAPPSCRPRRFPTPATWPARSRTTSRRRSLQPGQPRHVDRDAARYVWQLPPDRAARRAAPSSTPASTRGRSGYTSDATAACSPTS